MTDKATRYIKRQRESGIVIYKVMIPESRKEELKQLAEKWREEHRRQSS